MTRQHSSLANIYLNPSAGPLQEGILGLAKGVGRGALQMGKEMIVSQLAGAVAGVILSAVVGGVMGRKKNGPVTDADIDHGIDEQIAKLPTSQQQVFRGDRARIRAEVKNQLNRRGRRESLVDIYREADSPWTKILTAEETQALSDSQRKSYQQWLNSAAGKAVKKTSKPNKVPVAASDSTASPKAPKKVSKAPEAPVVTKEAPKSSTPSPASRGHLTAVSDPINPAKASNPKQPPVKPKKLTDIYTGAATPGNTNNPLITATVSQVEGKLLHAPPTPARPLSGLQRLKDFGKAAAHEIEDYAAKHPSKVLIGGVALGVVIGGIGAKVVSMLSNHPTGMSDGDLMREIDNNLDSYLRGMPGEQSVSQRARIDPKFRSHLVQEIFVGARKKVPRPGEKTQFGKIADQAKANGWKFAKDGGGRLAKAAAVYGTAHVIEKATRGLVKKDTTASIISGGSIRIGGGTQKPAADPVSQVMSNRDLRKHMRTKLNLNTEKQTEKREDRAYKKGLAHGTRAAIEGDRALKFLPISNPKVQNAISQYMEREYREMSDNNKKLWKSKMADPSFRRREEQDVYDILKAQYPTMVTE